MDINTRRTLLNRLKVAPGEADWEQFYQKYKAVIISFARKRGLDDASALDVLQETMMVLLRKLPEFDYQPERGRFRNWLFAVVANRSFKAISRSRADRLVSLDALPEEGGPLEERIAGGDPGADAVLEESWRQSLLEGALQRLLSDPRTQPETIAVFRAVALEERPVAEVAAEFGIKENAVYQIKNRLMIRLQALISEMEEDPQKGPK